MTPVAIIPFAMTSSMRTVRKTIGYHLERSAALTIHRSATIFKKTAPTVAVFLLSIDDLELLVVAKGIEELFDLIALGFG